MVVVVRSGTSIVELEKILSLKNQTLGFDPPRFSESNKNISGGTVGGMVAAGLSGPQRILNGSCREAVLGISTLNAKGELLRFGGTVIKNVAGYDISRLHVGAMGTLGLILDISLRVKPLPLSEETIAIPANFFEMIQIVEGFFSNQLPISSTSWTNKLINNFFEESTLILKLAGAEVSVAKAKDFIFNNQKKAFCVERNKANKFWNFLRDQQFTFFSNPLKNDSILWRLSLPFGSDFLLFDDMNQWIEWGGALRWIRTDEDPEWIFSVVKRHGGTAMIYKVPANSKQIKDRLPQPEWVEKELHKKIKKRMDPESIFNPGRLYSFL